MAPASGKIGSAQQVTESWPAPTALVGVKSQKRPIFKVEKADLSISEAAVGFCVGSALTLESRIAAVGEDLIEDVDTGKEELQEEIAAITTAMSRHKAVVCTCVGIALSLESRIAAIGKEGRAVVSLLLGRQEPLSGEALRHAGLTVVHLGPHLAGKAAEAEEHTAAVAAALQARPHVVVLDEAADAAEASSTWLRIFARLLRCEALQSFRGAVVVVGSGEVTFAMRRACSEHWVVNAGGVRQEELSGRQIDIVEDAFGAFAAASAGATAKPRKGRGRQEQQQDAEAWALLDAARELSEFCFEEDVAQKAKREGWTVSLLVETTADSTRNLRGFLCHRRVAAQFRIERLAVPTKHRGRGFAQALMQWFFDEGARLSPSECEVLACSAVKRAAKFYERLGFAPAERQEAPTAEELEGDPQIWMERPNASLLAPSRAPAVAD